MICAFDGSSMLNVLRRLCGQLSAGPRIVLDQSIARMRDPISPPPCRKVCENAVSTSAIRRDYLATLLMS
jgi:hypothetical protein